jgi:putative hydrolase of the HAD superfamily
MVRAVLPKENARVLRTLATDRRLGLVSNFDHSASVRGLLCRLGLDQFFSSIVISIEQGRRKPHPEIFRAALNELGAVPRAALFVGDNLRVDVGGAQAAGIDAAWLNPEGGGADPRQPEPRFVIRQLADLHAILDS